MQVATLNLALGNAERNFHFRKGTRDEVAIVQALKNGAYQFGQLRRGKELSEYYGRLAGGDKAPLIIDAGAGIGASAVYFAHAFPKAHVVAIEPDPDNFELLKANTADLAVECVHSPADQNFSGSEINTIYEQKAQSALPFIVKLDIAHGGSGLLTENASWLERTPVLIIQLQDCLIPGTSSSRAFVEHIADHNRDFVYLHDSIFSISRDSIPFHVANQA